MEINIKTNPIQLELAQFFISQYILILKEHKNLCKHFAISEKELKEVEGAIL